MEKTHHLQLQTHIFVKLFFARSLKRSFVVGYSQIYQCMNDKFVDEKYGFRPNISTEIASQKLINEIILVAMNKKMSVGGGGYIL